MASRKAKKFAVRYRGKEIETGISERAVVRMILSGKLLGEEEIAEHPYLKWQKISTHGKFYDALLKRLYEDEYQAGEGSRSAIEPEGTSASQIGSLAEESDVPSEATNRTKNEPSRKSRRGGQTRSGQESKEPKTRKIRGLVEERPDAKEESAAEPKTGEGSLFANLFSEHPSDDDPKNREQNADTVAPPEGGLLSVPLEGGELSPDAHLPHNLNQFSPAVEESGDVKDARKSADKRKRLIRIGIAAGFLLILYMWGTGGPHDRRSVVNVSTGPEPASISSDLANDPDKKAQQVQVLIEEGQRLAESDTPLFYVGAQEFFNDALALDGTRASILGNLAEVSARLYPESSEADGLDEQVREFVKKGRVIDPQNSQFYLAESLLALYSNKPADALARIRDALKTDPSNLANLLAFAEISVISGNRDQAKTTIAEVLGASPKIVRAHHLAAKIALDEKDYETARREALATLKLNPIHASSYYVLGKIDLEQSKLEEAKQLLQTAVGLALFGSKRDMGKAHYYLGNLQEMLGDKAATDHFRLAYYYAWPESKAKQDEKLKGADLKEKALQALAAKNEYGRNYFANQAETLLSKKRYADALTFLQAASLMQPNDGKMLVKIGETWEKIAYRREDIGAIASYYQKAIEKEPGLALAYIRLGLFESEQYNLDRATKLLDQAAALAPQESEPYVALGKHYYRSHDYRASIKNFEKAFELNPGDADILYYAGLLRPLGKTGGEKEALTFFYRAYLLNPQHYDALVEWLKLRVVAREKLFAVKFLRNLLEQEPENPNFYWALGEVYAANKEHRKAIDYYHKALDLDPKFSKVRMAAAKSLEEIGDLESAAEEYQTASKRDPKNHEGYFRAADLYFQLKKYDKAENFLNSVVERCPNYPGVYRYLSRIAIVRGKRDEAVAMLQKEVDKHPLNSKYRIELAELLMGLGKFDDAIKQLNEVTDQAGAKKKDERDDYAFERIRGYLLLSRCLRATGKYESAEGAIHLALDTDPNDPELHRELGYVYHGLQRDKEAVKAFEFYLERNPAAADGNEIRTLIKGIQIEE